MLGLPVAFILFNFFLPDGRMVWGFAVVLPLLSSVAVTIKRMRRRIVSGNGCATASKKSDCLISGGVAIGGVPGMAFARTLLSNASEGAGETIAFGVFLLLIIISAVCVTIDYYRVYLILRYCPELCK